jgi:hypothetical protein
MRRMVVAERKGLANEKVHHQFELGPGANQATAEYKRIAVMPFYRRQVGSRTQDRGARETVITYRRSSLPKEQFFASHLSMRAGRCIRPFWLGGDLPESRA